MRALVHIGVGKTGTTSLQRNLFARHKEILNIGRPFGNDNFKRAMESLREDDDSDYRPSVLSGLFSMASSEARGRSLVLSDEALVHPVHQSLVARRLFEALPEAHILLTIRNQYDLVASYWAAHGRNLKGVPKPYLGKTVNLDDWFAFEAEAKRSFFRRLDFNRLYRIYAGIFGTDRVHVMTFEALATSPLGFAQELAVLLGVDAGEMSGLILAPPAKTRPSAAATWYQALRPRVLPNVSLSGIPGGAAMRRAFHRFVETGPTLRVTLRPAQRATIRQRFGSGNEALEAAIGIDLKSLRYPALSHEVPSRDKEMNAAAPT